METGKIYFPSVIHVKHLSPLLLGAFLFGLGLGYLGAFIGYLNLQGGN